MSGVACTEGAWAEEISEKQIESFGSAFGPQLSSSPSLNFAPCFDYSQQLHFVKEYKIKLFSACIPSMAVLTQFLLELLVRFLRARGG